MARRPNYGFQKRQKELKRQQKKDEKAARKRLKKELPDDTAVAGSDLDTDSDAEDVNEAE